MTIHCVTPNPAVDITYRVESVSLHGVNRVDEVTVRPGGKGVNVARILAARGHDVAVHGFLGGAPGAQLRELLERLQPGIEECWTSTQADTRLTIAVVDDQDTTMFNEPGRMVAPADWERLTDVLAARCALGDVVTVSGSLPAGSNPRELGALVTRCKGAGALVIVDTSGPGLLAAAHAGADVLKPNRQELLEATGAPDVKVGSKILLHGGGGAVITSLGADGLALATTSGTVVASLGSSLTGNPTGAGDALVAAVAAGLSSTMGTSWAKRIQDALPTAIGWSAAAVLSPVAGEIDDAVVDELIGHVTIKEL